MPSINAALGADAPSAMRDYNNAASPFIRSGSAAGFHGGGPSRTQSPLAGPGISAPPPSSAPPPPPGPPYVLPPPHTHGIGHAHGHSFYAHQPSTPPPPMPTLQELQRHLAMFEEGKKWMVEMVERTERMMVGMKRSIDEMIAGGAAGGGAGSGGGVGAGEKSPKHQHASLSQESGSTMTTTTPAVGGSSTAAGGTKSPRPDQSPKLGSSPVAAPAVPLGARTGGEKPVQRDSVWPVAPPQSPKRD